MMKNRRYYRIMLGRGSIHADECYENEFIGTHFGFDFDLSNELPDDWRKFNAKYRPVYLEIHPDKSKVAAGLACGAVWTISKGIFKGDIVLCPNGNNEYWVGEVISDYIYAPGEIFPHRRKVAWLPFIIPRPEMSQALQNSTGSIGTVSRIDKHAEEIEAFIKGHHRPMLIATDELIEDASEFALEKHLEDFLVKNWQSTQLGKTYDIFEEDGELVGQQYLSDTGPIDILAISKDKKELLVVELKKGRASDSVVGQIQRYMGYVKDELTESGQSVRGVIIASEDDLKIRRALSVANNIEFYRFKVTFKLFKNKA